MIGIGQINGLYRKGEGLSVDSVECVELLKVLTSVELPVERLSLIHGAFEALFGG